MKALFAHFALRDAGCGRPQTDIDVGDIVSRLLFDDLMSLINLQSRRHFYINVRSIRWPPDIDQRPPSSNTNTEEKVSAMFVPEETNNYIGKAFFETWCDTHGYFRPKIDIVWLEFSLDGQTQRFESVHQIIDNGESVQFYSNRSPALEKHIREYCINLPERHDSAHPKQAVAVRSRTWPNSLRRLPRISGNQYAREMEHEMPVIRLFELKDNVDIYSPAMDSNGVAENHGGNQDFLDQYASKDMHRDDVSAMMATSQVAVSSGGSSSQNNSAFECIASSDDVCIEHIQDNQNLIGPESRAIDDIEASWEPIVDLGDQSLDTKLNGNVRCTSSYEFPPMCPAGTDISSLDDQLQTGKSATRHKVDDLACVSELQGTAEPGSADNTLLDSTDQNSSIPGEYLGVEESHPYAQSEAASQQSVHDGTVNSVSLDTDYSGPESTVGSPNSSEYTAFTGELRCHSNIRDISLADPSFSTGSEQQEEFALGNMTGVHYGAMAQEVLSPHRIGHREPGLSTTKPCWLDRVPVRKDEPPNFAKSSAPAVASSTAILPDRNTGKLNTTEIHYNNTAMNTSSKEVTDFNNGKQEPGGSKEKAAWDLDHESDQASMQSPDSEGLPFPDDYWIYDETAGNYYHVEVEDDGTETISWYPLEFD
jgi:hypothetical protein